MDMCGHGRFSTGMRREKCVIERLGHGADVRDSAYAEQSSGLYAWAAGPCGTLLFGTTKIKSHTKGNDAFETKGKHGARGCCHHTPPSKLYE